MKLTLLVFLLFFAHDIFGQSLSQAQTLEDLGFLIEQIETYNPGLEAYNPRFRAQADSILGVIDQDEYSPIEHFAYVSQVCALSHEGHFHLGDWGDAVLSGFNQDEYAYLPLSVQVIAGKIYLKAYYGEEADLQPGDEILKINGVPVGDVLQRLFQHIPSDGRIVTHLERQAGRGFSWMYYMYVGQPETFELGFLSGADRLEKTVDIPALRKSQQQAFYRERMQEKTVEKPAKGIQDFYELRMEEDHAYLRLKSFDWRLVEKYKLVPKKFYKEIFAEIAAASVAHLVIDLRGNTGGRYGFAEEMVPFILKSNTDDYLRKATSWKGKVVNYAFPKQSKLAFAGGLFVLIDGGTFSSGATLARYLKEYGEATVIGVESGSRYEGFVAGSSERVFLPHGGTKVEIPIYHSVYAPSRYQKTVNRGQLPDVEVQATWEELAAGKDPVLQAALDLIKN